MGRSEEKEFGRLVRSEQAEENKDTTDAIERKKKEQKEREERERQEKERQDREKDGRQG